MFFSNNKNISKNNIKNSIFNKERKVKSEDNLLFIKISNRFHLRIKPVRDKKIINEFSPKSWLENGLRFYVDYVDSFAVKCYNYNK